MKSPYRYLMFVPAAIFGPLLAIQIFMQARGLQWPGLTKFMLLFGKPLLVAIVLWILCVMFLEWRWRARKNGPARLSDCHACGYELTGETHHGRCPECNAIFKTP